MIIIINKKIGLYYMPLTYSFNKTLDCFPLL